MLFFPPFLGGTMLVQTSIYLWVVPFLSFCLVSSSTYIFNDLCDRERDAYHPLKKMRPLQSGRISLRGAAIFAVILLGFGLWLGASISLSFFYLQLCYLTVTLAYSLWLKQQPIIDLFCISTGFLLRLHAGGEAFDIRISEWLFLTVFLMSIFLSTGKRLCEKISLGEFAGEHRQSLNSYPAGLLDGIMFMTGGAVLVTYTMYVINRHALLYSVPISCFVLLRYMYRVKSGVGGDPTDSLLRDPWLFPAGAIWTAMVGWVVYGL
jgi:4-hydroxybenzoate polyprenyltransferase